MLWESWTLDRWYIELGELRERERVLAAVVLDLDVALLDVDVGRAVFAHGPELHQMRVRGDVPHRVEDVQRVDDVVELGEHGVPADHIQAAAQVTYMTDNGCKKLYVLNDKEVYGKGVADLVAANAKTAGLTVLGNDGIDPKAANYRPIAGKIKSLGADCFFYGGITQNNGVQLWKDVFAANPSIKLFGPDGVAESAFSEKIGKSEANTFITNPTLDPKLYPAGAQKFFAAFKSKFGKDPEPYAIYGYEAMKVALLAIQNAGDKGNDRQAVVDAFYKIKNRQSVLGTYSIDANGDTTLSDYGGNKIKNGKLVFDKVIKAKTS